MGYFGELAGMVVLTVVHTVIFTTLAIALVCAFFSWMLDMNFFVSFYHIYVEAFLGGFAELGVPFAREIVCSISNVTEKAWPWIADDLGGVHTKILKHVLDLKTGNSFMIVAVGYVVTRLILLALFSKPGIVAPGTTKKDEEPREPSAVSAKKYRNYEGFIYDDGNDVNRRSVRLALKRVYDKKEAPQPAS